MGKCRCGVLAVNTVWSTPERIRGEVLTTMRYTNRCLPYTLPTSSYDPSKLYQAIYTTVLWYQHLYTTYTRIFAHVHPLRTIKLLNGAGFKFVTPYAMQVAVLCSGLLLTRIYVTNKLGNNAAKMYKNPCMVGKNCSVGTSDRPIF